MDNDKYGWIGLALGFLVAAVREVIGAYQRRQDGVKRDEITFLNMAVADLQKKHDLCELRCEELQSNQVFLLSKVMPLLEHINAATDPPKRKRKTAAQ